MCEAQGLRDISLTIFKERITIKQGFQLIGGPRNFWKLMRLMIVLSRKSPAIRYKFKIQAKVKKIVFSSSSEVYGDPLEHPQRESYFGNVNMIGPRSCYDEGKRAAETLCFEYHREK